MLDWNMQTNAIEMFGGAIVQVSVVVLTAFLTWFVTYRSDRARSKSDENREYNYQIDRYYEDLIEVLNVLDEMAMDHQGGFTADQIRRYERFQNRVRWKPRPEDLIVDVWVRTELSRIPTIMQNLDEAGEWDEYDVHRVRSDIQEVGRRFLQWTGGSEPTSSFREEMEANSMRVTSPRFDDPLEDPQERYVRMREALRESWRLVRRAWRGNPSSAQRQRSGAHDQL